MEIVHILFYSILVAVILFAVIHFFHTKRIKSLEQHLFSKIYRIEADLHLVKKRSESQSVQSPASAVTPPAGYTPPTA